MAQQSCQPAQQAGPLLTSVLITEANLSLGQHLTRELLKLNPKVLIACCRNPDNADELQKLKNENTCIKILKLDMSNGVQWDSFAKEVEKTLGDIGLQLLIHNAGTPDDPKSIEKGEMVVEFKLNVVAPIQISTRLRPFLEMWASKAGGGRRATVATISSQRILVVKQYEGSIIRRSPSGTAVLKMMTKALKNDLGQHVQTVSVHPNWAAQNPPPPEKNVPQIVRLITGQMNIELDGNFLNYDGTPMAPQSYN